MHLFALAVSIAAAARLLLAAPTPSTALPEYFQVKSHVLAGQTGKKEFDGLLLGFKTFTSTTQFYPSFGKLNADSLILQLQPALPANGSYPALSYLNWNMTSGPTFRAGLEFNQQPDAAIDPTVFDSVRKPVKGEVVQNRFYLNQTSSGIFLEWSSNKTALASQQFRYWLLCQSQYTFISLYFAPETAGATPPFSCAEVHLQAIPIEP